MIKTVLLSSAMLLIASPIVPGMAESTAPIALDAPQLAAARDLVDTILPPEKRDAMFAGMIDAMMANMTRGIIQGEGVGSDLKAHPDEAAVLGRFIDRQRMLVKDDLKTATPALINAYGEAYAKRFSLDELRQVKIFFASSLGQKYQATSLEILSDPAIAKWQTDVAARGQERLKTELPRFVGELQDAIKKDQAEHEKPS